MFDKDAIKELTKAEAITAADKSIAHTAAGNVLALPTDYELHDLEVFLPQRRRARGTMATSVAEHFASYVEAHMEEGAAVFVDPDRMAASAVLNLGTPIDPGHADNIAALKLRQTAPYVALLGIATGAPQKQTTVAEFLEDWGPHITCTDADGAEITLRQAVSAVRRITIESASKVESAQTNLRAERSAFESVQASSVEPIPVFITFRCEPYQGLALRPFVSRLGVITGGTGPTLTLRLINHEQHKEEMAAELAALVNSAMKGNLPVHIGTYSAKA